MDEEYLRSTIKKIKDFISDNNELKSKINKVEKHFIIDYLELIKFNIEIDELLQEDADSFFECAKTAIGELRDDGKLLDVRIKNVDGIKSNFIRIRDIRAENINQFWCVKGLIRQISDVRPLITYAKFECPSCTNIIIIKQPFKLLQIPHQCGCGRKGRLILKDKIMENTQRMILEEDPEGLEGELQPRRVNVFLTRGLTSTELDRINIPGSMVVVSGIIREIPISTTQGETTERQFVFEANYIQPTKEISEALELNDKDLKEIKELASRKDICDLLVQSYAPDIYGHNKIKLAMILLLFGGTTIRDEGKLIRRGNFHILLIGDPACAKSTLAKYCQYVSPKYRYTSGSKASGAGLTASITKDEFIGSWALEAGAIILASGGVCIVDELDKMQEEQVAKLNEVMEHQVSSIDKANIHATLKSETSMIGIANPKESRFDTFRPIQEQFNINPTLLSRFDLIFPIKDIPNEEFDTKVIETIIDVRKSSSKIKPKIKPNLLKKYIYYAKNNIFPKITEKAEEAIKKVYIKMRKANYKEEGYKSLSLTARQGEGIIRLAEASARVRFSNEVKEEDVKRAEELITYYLTEVCYDYEIGGIDVDRVEGMPISERNIRHEILDLFNELQDKLDGIVPIDDIVNGLKSKGYEEYKIEDAIAKMLREGGDFFQPKNGFLKKL